MGKTNTAHAWHPLIAAVVEERFRYNSMAQLEGFFTRLRTLSQHIRNTEAKADAMPELVLWVKRFAVTTDEIAQGFIGHWMKISARVSEDGKIIPFAEKIFEPLRTHPLRGRVERSHPNWGHPTLRKIERKKNWESLDAAREALLSLHEEFPSASIPGKDKLHVMVYDGKHRPPIRKMVLKLEASAEGVRITAADQKPKSRKQETMPALQEITHVQNPQSNRPILLQQNANKRGRFTSMVMLQGKAKPIKSKKPRPHAAAG